MNKRICIVGASLLVAGSLCAMTSQQAVDMLKASSTETNQVAPVISNAAPSSVVVESSPVATPDLTPAVIAAGTFVRPSIGIKNGRLTVSAEGSGMASIWTYQLIGGKWVGGLRLSGSKATADRVYVVTVCEDITSFRFGPKSGGVWKGPGLILANGKTVRAHCTDGAARLASDGSKLFLMSKNANWAQIDPATGAMLNTGCFAPLTTGEKLAFCISTSGTWICGMGGYSKQDASVAIGTAKGGKVIPVASWKAYPEMSSDMVYCDVAMAPDGTVWFASVYKDSLCLQQVANGKPRWPLDALFKLGDAVQGDRYPPRLCVAAGRLWAIWEAPGRSIMAADVYAVLKGKKTAVKLTSGAMPAVTAFADTIHLVYVADGKLQYKAIKEN